MAPSEERKKLWSTLPNWVVAVVAVVVLFNPPWALEEVVERQGGDLEVLKEAVAALVEDQEDVQKAVAAAAKNQDDFQEAVVDFVKSQANLQEETAALADELADELAELSASE